MLRPFRAKKIVQLFCVAPHQINIKEQDDMFQVNRLVIWFIFLLLSFFLFFIIWGDQGFIELQELRSEYRQLYAQSKSLEQENVNLHRLIERLKHDPKYVERIARTELGMIRANEMIIQFSRRKP